MGDGRGTSELPIRSSRIPPPAVQTSPLRLWQTAPRSAYLHVPFCLHRCGYCDFTLVADRDDLIPDYLTALRHEIHADRQSRAADSDPQELDTLFIGGGTPSHLSNDQITALGKIIAEAFNRTAGCEVTMEANPDGLSRDRMQAIRNAGVNRLSLGVQSFDNNVLQTLERQHDAETAEDVIQMASGIFDSVSIDLIFGVPGQTEAIWHRSLENALRLPVQHVSTYGLTFEKGTSFFQRKRRGELLAVPDETERRMYADAIDTLADAGFRHYEISNFGRRGHECRHNMIYWTGRPYQAYGPGAARYLNGIRSINARHVGRWLRSWLQHEPALQESEQLDAEARAREAIFLRLRLIDGFDLSEFTAQFDFSVTELSGEALQQHLTRGNLEMVGPQLRLTREGRFIADSVVSDFLV